MDCKRFVSNKNLQLIYHWQQLSGKTRTIFHWIETELHNVTCREMFLTYLPESEIFCVLFNHLCIVEGVIQYNFIV